ncbi:hypothetical protein MIMGU_mgv1a017386mg [Erythranthe guttata]|uniref:Uncharacterized protein n=1 Tax=Erythranthe guttata TaxID=4155 RepID=A0A022PVI0_ERYGU|nr:hypothetical protein MIMGU_mgv1a017386mg [Erythranthe guttata]
MPLQHARSHVVHPISHSKYRNLVSVQQLVTHQKASVHKNIFRHEIAHAIEKLRNNIGIQPSIGHLTKEIHSFLIKKLP